MSLNWDMGGNDLIVNTVSVGATAPGQAGTTLSGSEIIVLDSVTGGIVSASKAVVVDSNKDITTFRNLTATNHLAGASGTAGTVDIFPTTAAKGKIEITAADSSGNTTTTITNASQAAARTYTIPDAGASASFVLSTGTSTGVAVTSTEFGVLASAAAANSGTTKALITGTSGAVTLVTPTVTGVLAHGAASTTTSNASAVTCSSNAATTTTQYTKITSESLTTAHTASQALVITYTGITTAGFAVATIIGGTNTQGVPVLKTACTTDTVTITIQNNAIATNAFNGTFIIWLQVFKA